MICFEVVGLRIYSGYKYCGKITINGKNERGKVELLLGGTARINAARENFKKETRTKIFPVVSETLTQGKTTITRQ